MSLSVPVHLQLRTASVAAVQIRPATANLIGQGDLGLLAYCSRILDMLRLSPIGLSRETIERIGDKAEVGRALRILQLANFAWRIHAGSVGNGQWTEAELWFHGPDPDLVELYPAK